MHITYSIQWNIFSCSVDDAPSENIPTEDIQPILDPLTDELKGEYHGAVLSTHYPTEPKPIFFKDSVLVIEEGYPGIKNVDIVSLDSLTINENDVYTALFENAMDSDTLIYARQEYLLRKEKEIWTTSSYSHNIDGVQYLTGYYKYLD